jgi:membrane fusion protein (multidrug efflux system)
VRLISANRADAEPVVSAVRGTGGMIDAVTGAAEVRVPVPAGSALLLGEHVKASIELAKKETLVAPRQAVLPDDDKTILYTVKAGKAVRHEVTVGITAGDLVEVSGPGLQPGDAAVTLGNYEAKPAETAQEAKEAKP